MRDIVRAKAYDFNEPMEGDIPYFYQDAKGLVSIGVGLLCDPLNGTGVYSLPLMRRDGAPASREEIAAEWLRIKNLGPDAKGRTAAQLGGAAEVRAAADAHFALPAEHREAADDMVAGLHVGNLVTDGFNDAGRFVPEDGRCRERIEHVNEVEVAGAHAGGHGLDEDFVALGLIDIDLFDGEGLMRPVENGGFHW